MKYIFLHICVKESPSRAMERSCSHFIDGTDMDLLECNIILYILERSFFSGEGMLIRLVVAEGRDRFAVLIFIFDWIFWMCGI